MTATPVADANGIDFDLELPAMDFWKTVAKKGFTCISMNFTKRLTRASLGDENWVHSTVFLPTCIQREVHVQEIIVKYI